MNNYQLTLLVKNDLDEKKRASLLDSLKKDFGSLTKEDLWGSRNLSYPISHMDKAFYAHFEFSSEPSAILDLDRKIKLNEDIVRYILLKVETKKKQVKAKKETTKEEITEEAKA